LESVARIIREGSFFISNDSGMAHLAAICDIPQIAIFSGRDRPGLWYPGESKNVKVFRKDFKCAPCFVDDRCEFDSACIRDIGVEEVWQFLLKDHM